MCSQKWCKAWVTCDSSRLQKPRSHSRAVCARRLRIQESMGDEGASCRQKGLQNRVCLTHSALPFLLEAAFHPSNTAHPRSLTSSKAWGTNFSPMALRIKRSAFQILLQKCRELRTSETDRCKSPPGSARWKCKLTAGKETVGSCAPAPAQELCANTSLTPTYQGLHGSTGQISGHLSRTQGSLEEIPFSVTEGGQKRP